MRRVFDAMDRNRDGKVDFKELTEVLGRLDYKAKKAEVQSCQRGTSGRSYSRLSPALQVEDMIWEVDEDCDKMVCWEEFKLMFERCRSDKTGLEPRKLFNVVEFMMHDKDQSGSIDMDECMEILFRRFGKDQLEERTNEFFKHDIDGDNNISFMEFQKQMNTIRPKRREAGRVVATGSKAASSTSVSR